MCRPGYGFAPGGEDSCLGKGRSLGYSLTTSELSECKGLGCVGVGMSGESEETFKSWQRHLESEQIKQEKAEDPTEEHHLLPQGVHSPSLPVAETGALAAYEHTELQESDTKLFTPLVGGGGQPMAALALHQHLSLPSLDNGMSFGPLAPNSLSSTPNEHFGGASSLELSLHRLLQLRRVPSPDHAAAHLSNSFLSEKHGLFHPTDSAFNVAPVSAPLPPALLGMPAHQNQLGYHRHALTQPQAIDRETLARLLGSGLGQPDVLALLHQSNLLQSNAAMLEERVSSPAPHPTDVAHQHGPYVKMERRSQSPHPTVVGGSQHATVAALESSLMGSRAELLTNQSMQALMMQGSHGADMGTRDGGGGEGGLPVQQHFRSNMEQNQPGRALQPGLWDETLDLSSKFMNLPRISSHLQMSAESPGLPVSRGLSTLVPMLYDPASFELEPTQRQDEMVVDSQQLIGENVRNQGAQQDHCLGAVDATNLVRLGSSSNRDDSGGLLSRAEVRASVLGLNVHKALEWEGRIGGARDRPGGEFPAGGGQRAGGQQWQDLQKQQAVERRAGDGGDLNARPSLVSMLQAEAQGALGNTAVGQDRLRGMPGVFGGSEDKGGAIALGQMGLRTPLLHSPIPSRALPPTALPLGAVAVSAEALLPPPPSKPPPTKQRAKRGRATDSHSLAERGRRERIADRLRSLQVLIPNAERLDTVMMLEAAWQYIRKLEDQLQELKDRRETRLKAKGEQEQERPPPERGEDTPNSPLRNASGAGPTTANPGEDTPNSPERIASGDPEDGAAAAGPTTTKSGSVMETAPKEGSGMEERSLIREVVKKEEDIEMDVNVLETWEW